MGKIALFTIPKVEPALPWFPTDAEVERYGRERVQEMQWSSGILRQIDDSTREKVAILVSVLGMKDLATLCVECALAEISKLCERPDVNAVLGAYQRSPFAAERRAR